MKKLFVSILSAVIIMSTPNYTFKAQAGDTFSIPPSPTNDQSLLYIAIGQNTPTLNIVNKNGIINSIVSISENYSYKIITTLQRSTNQTSWTNVCTWTETGRGSISKTFTYNYTTAINLYYQVKCTIEVYNTNNTLLESNTEYSNIVRCT